MKINFIILLIFVMAFTGTSCNKSDNADSPSGIKNEDPLIPETKNFKILFIGASYFSANELLDVFQNFASFTNKNILIGNRCLPGRYLEYHASNEQTQNKINEEDWDYVVLQGVGVNVAYPEIPDYYPNTYLPLFPPLTDLYKQIKDNYAETVVIFAMPWAFEDGMTWVVGGEDETYEVMQQKIYDNTLEITNSLDIGIAPVGWAFNQIMLENPPLHYLFIEDFNHPSVKGTYLIACVLYASIFQENPELINLDSDAGSAYAEVFQEVANSIVFTNFYLWNIPPLQN